MREKNEKARHVDAPSFLREVKISNATEIAAVINSDNGNAHHIALKSKIRGRIIANDTGRIIPLSAAIRLASPFLREACR